MARVIMHGISEPMDAKVGSFEGEGSARKVRGFLMEVRQDHRFASPSGSLAEGSPPYGSANETPGSIPSFQFAKRFGQREKDLQYFRDLRDEMVVLTPSSREMVKY
ncbi:hypothetical protein E3N88_29020 [Mikania micrantha]|uniref:Uncharacterized protein n=1 Tax=Mikania micrantha TaxID=192012 RepID=A0A5N6N167_9ASTR|nr:hypothetical protein E3N88_29020 [Mikania micrantha]